MTRLRRMRYGKSRPVREERRVGALRIMRRSTIRRQYMTPRVRVYLRRSPRDSETSLSVPAAKHTHPRLVFMIRRLQGRCLSLGGHRVTDRLLRIFMIAGDLSAYLIGLIVEREFGSQARLIVFLALYFLFLWVSWLLAVWMTEPKRAAPA